MSADSRLSELTDQELLQTALGSAQSSRRVRPRNYNSININLEKFIIELISWCDHVNKRIWKVKCLADDSELSHGEIIRVIILVYQPRWPFIFRREIQSTEENQSDVYSFMRQLTKLSDSQQNTQKPHLSPAGNKS